MDIDKKLERNHMDIIDLKAVIFTQVTLLRDLKHGKTMKVLS